MILCESFKEFQIDAAMKWIDYEDAGFSLLIDCYGVLVGNGPLWTVSLPFVELVGFKSVMAAVLLVTPGRE